VSGDTIQLGSEITITSSVDIVSSSYNPSAGRHVVSYRNGGTGGKGYARLVKVDGIEAEADGGTVQLNSGFGTSNISTFTESVYYPKTGKTVVGMLGAADYKTYVCGLTISEDGVLTADEDKRLSQRTSVSGISMTYDPSAEMLAVIQVAGSTYSVVYSPGGTFQEIKDINLTYDNFIGVSVGDYSDGDEATVQISGINPDQRGMTVGEQYVMTDGTLDTTEGDPSVFAGTAISSTYLIIKG
jgi:hypothetical protein